jgi:hypothetical protein
LSGQAPARDARTLAVTAAACAGLVFIVVAASAWLRLTPAGVPCPPAGCEGFTVADAVRIAHRVAAMGVSVLALLITAIAWKAPASWRRRAASVAILLLVAVLAVVGRQSSGTVLPAVTLTNLLGGLALLACTAGLAASARAPAGRASLAFVAAAGLLAAAIATGAVASALPSAAGSALGLAHHALSWAAYAAWGVLAIRITAPERNRTATYLTVALMTALLLLAVTVPGWAPARWLHNLLTSAALVAGIVATMASRDDGRRASASAQRALAEP